MDLIAVASDDENAVSEHFNGAACYVVLRIDEGRIVGREVRKKPKRGGSGAGKGKQGQSGTGRQIGQSLSTIRDCGTVVARGIGDRACEGIRKLGLEPLITDLETVDQVAQAVLEGRLDHHSEGTTRSPGVWQVGEA